MPQTCKDLPGSDDQYPDDITGCCNSQNIHLVPGIVPDRQMALLYKHNRT